MKIARVITVFMTAMMEEVPIHAFFHFLQEMAYRRTVGSTRYEKYGVPIRRQRYMTRMKRELKAYEKSGNHEQLLNIAVYAFLESYAPENRKYHFNPAVDSVTRKEMGV